MIIRSITDDDLNVINKLSSLQTDFKLESLGKVIIDKIAFEGNTPIAYGIVKNLAEAIILVNPSAPLPTRAKAMRELMLYAEYGAKIYGCEQLHCFVSDNDLAASLVKHFGFTITKDIVLVKNL